MSKRPRKLFDQDADAIRGKRYSYRTQQTCISQNGIGILGS